MIDKETKEAAPFAAFVKAERLTRDIASVKDAARGRESSGVGMALALIRNYDPFRPRPTSISSLMVIPCRSFGGPERGGKPADPDSGRARPADDVDLKTAPLLVFPIGPQPAGCLSLTASVCKKPNRGVAELSQSEGV